jgi:hypothetical protein
MSSRGGDFVFSWRHLRLPLATLTACTMAGSGPQLTTHPVDPSASAFLPQQSCRVDVTKTPEQKELCSYSLSRVVNGWSFALRPGRKPPAAAARGVEKEPTRGGRSKPGVNLLISYPKWGLYANIRSRLLSPSEQGGYM